MADKVCNLKADFTLGGGWGNAIHLLPSEDGALSPQKQYIRLYGFKSTVPSAGQTLLVDYKEDNAWVLFELQEIEPKGDPKDMFYAKGVLKDYQMKS